MKKQVLFILLTILVQFQYPSLSEAGHPGGEVLLIVKSSSTAISGTTLKSNSPQLLRGLRDMKPIGQVTEVPLSTNFILWEDDGGMVKTYTMDATGIIYNLETMERMSHSPDLAKKLRHFFNDLHKKHFGTLLSWEEGNKLLPMYSEFKVTDLETGMSFWAQRRAGSNHADVQPLTKKDTAIMKDIYDGEWSWNRRAVIVHYNDLHIAASMHGMPHGGGALANGFPGHFCIHLLGSKTHTTRNEDLSHQVMVYKGAGQLVEFVNGLDGEAVAKLFFIALKQNDLDLFQLIYHGEEDAQDYREAVRNVEGLRIIDQHEPPVDEPLNYELTVDYMVKQEGKGERIHTFTAKLRRDSPTSPWRLTNLPFEEW